MQKESTYTSKTKVTSANTAIALGSGDMEVFATPALVALMENAAMKATDFIIKSSFNRNLGTSFFIPSPILPTNIRFYLIISPLIRHFCHINALFATLRMPIFVNNKVTAYLCRRKITHVREKTVL